MFKFHLNLLISQMGVVGWVAGLQPFLVKRDVLGFNLLLITFFFFSAVTRIFLPNLMREMEKWRGRVGMACMWLKMGGPGE